VRLSLELRGIGASPGILGLVFWIGRRWGKECHWPFGIGDLELGFYLNDIKEEGFGRIGDVEGRCMAFFRAVKLVERDERARRGSPRAPLVTL
jgi:hypothetical protein